MVWFQCEDCGENLKKPKLPNHFRMCSATKLSCIDCGEMFGQESVQGHTQCITEAEKYGPKDQGKSPHGAQQKPNKPKQNADVDVNVGLSTRPPWNCSLCNTATTSKQTLLLHADGKKHRAKARAFHAAQNPSSQLDESTLNKDGEPVKIEANGNQSAEKLQVEEYKKDSSAISAKVETEKLPKKRKQEKEIVEDVSNGEVIQADTGEADSQRLHKKKKCLSALAENSQHTDKNRYAEEPSKRKIKWKKIITATLKSNPNGVLKVKKLQKLVLKAIKKSGIDEDEYQLRHKLMDKITSSSRFVVEDKCIRLATKVKSS